MIPLTYNLITSRSWDLYGLYWCGKWDTADIVTDWTCFCPCSYASHQLPHYKIYSELKKKNSHFSLSTLIWWTLLDRIRNDASLRPGLNWELFRQLQNQCKYPLRWARHCTRDASAHTGTLVFLFFCFFLGINKCSSQSERPNHLL